MNIYKLSPSPSANILMKFKKKSGLKNLHKYKKKHNSKIIVY